MSTESKDPVYERFIAYSSFGAKDSAGQLDSNMFSKLCRECSIINKGCTKTDVDLIFTKCKPKSGRKLDWRAFREALTFLAEKRFPKTFKETGLEAAVKKVEELICKIDGPQANATKAEFVKFHDDQSTYTGVYKQGGPTNVDAKITLSNLLDRSPADARGRKL
jgi:hypothetical protein